MLTGADLLEDKEQLYTCTKNGTFNHVNPMPLWYQYSVFTELQIFTVVIMTLIRKLQRVHCF